MVVFYYDSEEYKENIILKAIIEKYIKVFENKKVKKRSMEPNYKKKMRELDERGFEFYRGKNKIESWIDICCAPGYQLEYIKNIFPNAKYLGFTLNEEKGGFKLLSSIDKKNVIFKDISEDVDDSIKSIQKRLGKVDYVNINCIANHINDPNKELDYHLKILHSTIFIALSSLKINGNMYLFYTLKNPYIYGNLIYILSKFFKHVSPMKLRRTYQINSSIYLKCSEYVGGNIKKLRGDGHLIRDLHSIKLFSKEFQKKIEDGTKHGWIIQNDAMKKDLKRYLSSHQKIKQLRLKDKILMTYLDDFFKPKVKFI